MVKDEGRKPLFRFGDKVKISTRFLRSIGNFYTHSEDIGTVLVIDGTDDWILVTVCWSDGDITNINSKNLVQMDEVGREAMQAEHKDNVRGMVIGSNAYLKYD